MVRTRSRAPCTRPLSDAHPDGKNTRSRAIAQHCTCQPNGKNSARSRRILSSFLTIWLACALSDRVFLPFGWHVQFLTIWPACVQRSRSPLHTCQPNGKNTRSRALSLHCAFETFPRLGASLFLGFVRFFRSCQCGCAIGGELCGTRGFSKAGKSDSGSFCPHGFATSLRDAFRPVCWTLGRPPL